MVDNSKLHAKSSYGIKNRGYYYKMWSEHGKRTLKKGEDRVHGRSSAGFEGPSDISLRNLDLHEFWVIVPGIQGFFKIQLHFFPRLFSVEMNALQSADPQLSDAAISIKIGSRVWKIGNTIYSQGVTDVAKSKMVEAFEDQHATAEVEGVIVGRGATKKVCVRWTNLKVPGSLRDTQP
jgi:hypothetical protein